MTITPEQAEELSEKNQEFQLNKVTSHMINILDKSLSHGEREFKISFDPIPSFAPAPPSRHLAESLSPLFYDSLVRERVIQEYERVGWVVVYSRKDSVLSLTFVNPRKS